MIKGIENILLFSEDAKALSDFYIEKVGLKLTNEAVMGENEDSVLMFEFGKEKTSLTIMDHSKVKGKNKNPERMFFNLEVDDIYKEFQRLKKAGIKIIQEIYHIQMYGLVATFEDVDGNYFQIVQIKPN